MSNVVRPDQWWGERQPPRQPPPEPPDMEQRVAKLESIAEKTGERLAGIDVRLTRIEAKLDEFGRHGATKADMSATDARLGEFTKHYATKADLTEAKNSIIMWTVGAVVMAQLLPAIVGLVKHFFPA